MSQVAESSHAPTSTGIDHKKLIMWLFLASDCMFFGTLISTHLLYRKLYPTGFTDAEGHQRFIQNLFNIELTSFSTFILLMSSFLMALAVSAMHKGQIKSFRRNVLGVIFFGLIFLGCQVFVNDAHPPFLGDGDGQARLSDGVHGSRHQRKVELDAVRKLGG